MVKEKIKLLRTGGKKAALPGREAERTEQDKESIPAENAENLQEQSKESGLTQTTPKEPDQSREDTPEQSAENRPDQSEEPGEIRAQKASAVKKKPGKAKTKSRKKKKAHKNREILLVSYFFVFLFLGMMTYICVYVYQNQEVMINNSYNAGQQILVAQNRRGSIMARGGEVLAETDTRPDGSEVRNYPYDSLFSHVVGYSTKGKTGIEEKMNYYLIQSNVPINEKMDNGMKERKNPGDNVFTTLDVKMQEAANKALGVYEGAIVATNPKTGEVLAMVSKPDFNPNEISLIWEELLKDDESGVLLNRAAQGLYPPGSTFKIVTALEYIHENPSTYTNYGFTCNGSIKIDGSRIQCYHGTKHGKVTFERAFAKSCNASFANLGTKVDWNSFDQTLDGLLFGKKLPFDLESAVSTVKAEPGMTTEEQMQTAIGQGETLVSPLHMNLITCAIANDGVLQYPYVVDHVENSNGAVIKRFSSSGSTKMMSQQEAYILQGLMREVVESGTATKLLDQPYTAAGKTGSAEYNSARDSHAWFTGFAPVEDPEICVTVIIEGAGSGGDYAVPMARRVFDAYFNVGE
jgi:peptidoglycan glycosyltransferase